MKNNDAFLPDSSHYVLSSFGVLVGCVVYVLIFMAFEQFMLTFFKCEGLGAFDSIFLLDDKKSYSNILGCMMFEDFEFESMRDYLFLKTENLHKCRSKLVKVFGINFFQQMSENEWNLKKDQVIVHKMNIHTDEELVAFMCEQQGIRDPLDNVQYKFFLIPDFKDGQGVVVIKAHHVFSDGLGFSTFFLALSNVYDMKALPALKPVGFLKQALIYILLPFLILRISLVILFTFKNNNIIKRKQPMTGKKNGAFC